MGVQINGDTGNISATKADYSGNVTIGGTLTYEDVTNIDSVGLVTARSGIEVGARPGVAASISVDGNMIVSGISTFNNDVKLPDNKKIVLGADSDFRINHTGSHTELDSYTGNLSIRNLGTTGDIFIDAKSGERGIKIIQDGAVELYHDNEAKILTESNGATVQDLTATGTYLSITSSSGNNGKVYGVSGTTIGFLDNQNHWLIKGIKDGAVELYHDNSKKLETASGGVTVTGAVTATTFESSTFSKTPTNTPAFHAWSNNVTTHSLTNGTETKVTFLNSESLDTDSAYDNSTSGTTANRFTVPSGKGGYYQVSAGMNFYANANDIDHARLYIKQSGSTKITAYAFITSGGSTVRHFQANISGILNLAAGDYLELFVYMGTVGGAQMYISNDANGYRGNFFSAFKLII